MGPTRGKISTSENYLPSLVAGIFIVSQQVSILEFIGDSEAVF
jgi:hypothetical protein